MIFCKFFASLQVFLYYSAHVSVHNDSLRKLKLYIVNYCMMIHKHDFLVTLTYVVCTMQIITTNA